MMKIRYIILTIISLWAVVGCEESILLNDFNKETRKEYIVHVSADNSETKVSIDGVSVKWSAGDNIHIAEVNQDNTFGVFKSCQIINSSISSDGANADFLSNDLKPGRKYIAIHGLKTVNTGAVTTIEVVNQMTENKLIMFSPIVTIPSEGTPEFRFKHKQSLIECSITLANSVTDNYNLKQVIISHPSALFANKLLFDINGVASSSTPSGDAFSVTYNATGEPALSKTKSLTIRIPILWNVTAANVEGNFTITFITTDGKRATVTRPAKILQAGHIYTLNAAIEPLEIIKSDRDLLIDIYQEMGGTLWDENSNWCSEKPLDEWSGVKTSDGRVIKLEIITQKECQISDKIFLLDKLQELTIRAYVKGYLSAKIGDLKELKSLIIAGRIDAGDNLVGQLPSEISKLSMLEKLEITGHTLTGTIPTSLKNLSSLQVLELSYNRFTGTFPEDLVSRLPYYTRFSVKRNNLSGSLSTALQQSPKWASFAKEIVPQNLGYGFNITGVKFPFPHFSTTTIKNIPISTQTIIKNSELTIIHGWENTDPSLKFLVKLKELYNTYETKGLKIISHNSVDQQSAVEYIVTTEGMRWHNITDNIPQLRAFTTSPFVSVVNKSGDIIYDAELTSPKDTYDNLELFLKDYFKDEQYQSTDYSKDGEVTKLHSATVGRGIDIVLMGDGFTDKDMGVDGKYERRMKESLDIIFATEPMKSYQEYVNVYFVKAISKNEGIGDGKETIFNVGYGEGTAIEGDNEKVLTYVTKVSGVDISNVVVLVSINHSKYAGTCYVSDAGNTIAYCPYINESQEVYRRVVTHELIGHGLGLLFDEYIYNEGSITAESINEFNRGRNLFHMGYNLTISPTDIPWKHFLGLKGYSVVGTYEGGFFFEKGVWRAEENQCMNDNVLYFNAPSRELIVKRIMSMAKEKYTWESFLSKDKYVPVNARSKSFGVLSPVVHFAPPVLINNLNKKSK